MTLPPPLPAYRTDLFRPSYRRFDSTRWRLVITDMVLCPGYWTPVQLVTDLAALLRTDQGQTRTWMSMSPMEIESQELGCRHAVGDVVMMGLGMGWAAANAALNPAVTKVTVVELDPEVIDAVRFSGVIEQLPPEIAAKITIVQGDAYQFVPETPADTLFADIWLPLFGASRDQEVRHMQSRTGGTRVYFWGQEMVIADRARRRGLALTDQSVADIIADMALPLIGPAERPDYPELITRAAAKWLKPAEPT